MNRKDYHIGPGAASLLLIVVVLSMSVLGMLALMNARSDYRLSLRGAEVAVQAYTLADEAERSFARLDEILADCAKDAPDDSAWLAAVALSLPDSMMLDGRTVRWTEESQEENGRSLVCAVELEPLGAYPRARWTEHRLVTELEEDTEPQEELWQIWF